MDIINSIVQELSDIHFIGQFIGWLHSLIGDYGLTVVLFTVLLTIIKLPLDYWQRLSMKKTAVMQKALEPQMQAIDKKYPNDPQRANLEKQELLKKSGMSLFGGCLPLIVTMFIFIVMFQGLSAYSTYSSNMLFNKLADSYNEAYLAVYSAEQIEADEAALLKLKDEYGYDSAEYKALAEAIAQKRSDANKAAQPAVAKTFDEEHEGFLWVRNIYRPDTSAKVFATYDEAINPKGSGIGIDKEKITKSEYDVIYDAVMTSETAKGYFGGNWNGLFILPVLSIAFSIVSQLITQWINKKKGVPVDPQTASTNKMMMFMMPIMYAFFVFQYTAAFAVYIVCNAFISMGMGFVLNKLVEKKAEAAVMEKLKNNGSDNRPKYVRK